VTAKLLRAHGEKIAVVVAAGLVIGSGYWVRSERVEPKWALPDSPSMAAPEVDHREPAIKTIALEATLWEEAPAQSRGGEWIYEPFTPPVIYYNPQTSAFTVTARRDERSDAPKADVFPWELLEIKPEPYPLQLVGYFVVAGDYRIAFKSVGEPTPLLARVGDRFESAELTLRSFEVNKVELRRDESGPVYDFAGWAHLTEEKTGKDVVLTTRERKFTDAWLAVLRAIGPAEEVLELKEGAVFSMDEDTYRIEAILRESSEVIVARLGPRFEVADTKTLSRAVRSENFTPHATPAKRIADRDP
jgi:hypothetical protein